MPTKLHSSAMAAFATSVAFIALLAHQALRRSMAVFATILTFGELAVVAVVRCIFLHPVFLYICLSLYILAFMFYIFRTRSFLYFFCVSLSLLIVSLLLRHGAFISAGKHYRWSEAMCGNQGGTSIVIEVWLFSLQVSEEPDVCSIRPSLCVCVRLRRSLFLFVCC